MNRARKAAVAAALIALAAAGAAAQERSWLRAASRVDWAARALTLEIDIDVAGAGMRMPAARLDAERLVEQEFPALARDAVFGLPVDSYRDVGATVADGSLDVNQLVDLTSFAHRGSTFFSRDLRRFSATYSLSLGAVAGLYLSGAREAPLEEPLEYSPSRPYSGIVVDARGELPIQGERASGRLRACLFPRIYDEDMRLVLDRSNVAPEVLLESGPLAYARAASAGDEDRVGHDPLRTGALAVFGANRTDIVISRDDADRILALPENRDLVRSGRVLVFVDEP